MSNRKFVNQYRMSKNNNDYVVDPNGAMVALEYSTDGGTNGTKRDICISKIDDMESRIFTVTFVEQILDEGTWRTLSYYSAAVTDGNYVQPDGTFEPNPYEEVDNLDSPIYDEGGETIIGYNKKRQLKSGLQSESQFFIDHFSPAFHPLFLRTILNKKGITL